MDTFSVLVRKCLCCRQEKLLKIVLVNERYYGTKNLRHRFLCKISFQILIVEAGKSHVGIVKVQQKKSISKFLKLFRRRRLLQRLRTILKCSFFSAFVSGHHLQKANEFHIMFKRHAINMLDSAFNQVSPTSILVGKQLHYKTPFCTMRWWLSLTRHHLLLKNQFLLNRLLECIRRKAQQKKQDIAP